MPSKGLLELLVALPLGRGVKRGDDLKPIRSP
jgi:hypothetical protein